MKSTQQMFNPTIEDYKTLKEIVVERKEDLNSILNRLESTPLKGTSRNFIVMGPRGIGKTHFLLLIYYEIKERKKLNKKYISLKFSEEEYSIDSLAAFFIRIFEELMTESDNEKEHKEINDFLDSNKKLENKEFVTKADGFLEKLLHKRKKKIVLCAENLDEMFKNIYSSGKTDLKHLRSILQSRDYLLIIGSAPSYFKEIEKYDEPFYHFFEHLRLSPLSEKGIEELIMKLAIIEDNKRIIKDFNKVRPKIKIITHFTGGLPRLVRMLYFVIDTAQISGVMEQLEKLLDEITPYYQSRMMSISPQQQKIMDLIALAEGPSTPTEIAISGRMDRAIVNAQIRKLADMGFVMHSEQKRKRKERRYDITEKLFRIWREMRISKNKERIEFFTEFLKAFYSDDDFARHIVKINKKFSECRESGCNYDAVGYVREYEYLKGIIPEKMFFDYDCGLIEKYISLNELEKADAELKKLRSKIKPSKKFNEKITLLENKKNKKILEKKERAILLRIDLINQKKYKEAIRSCDESLKINPKDMHALITKAVVLKIHEDDKGAIQLIDKALNIKPILLQVMKFPLEMKADSLFKLKKYKEAIRISDEVLKINPKNEKTLFLKGESLSKLEKDKEAIIILDEVLKINPKNEKTLFLKGISLFALKKDKEAIIILDEVLKINPKDKYARCVKGIVFFALKKYKEALPLLEELLKINPKDEKTLFLKG
ncbi:MAG: AAA family ATPase, partial [Candidatus Aenigmarchaeota archaeon]|nr:AAA family ATPase [Candidatus Aenigmarchaeota archaeon]